MFGESWMSPLFKIVSLVVLLLAACAWNAAAQDATGKITGVVTDPSGAVVPNAKITVISSATNENYKAVTNSSGIYQILQLPIGLYRVAVEATGFRPAAAQPKTPLEINQTLRIDIQLQIGDVHGEVTVESNASRVETENSTIGATVTGQAIFELPLNGRNTLDLLKTQPGVSPANTDSQAAGAYSIGGMRTDSVTYLLDGGMNNSLLANGVVANPNPDAIAEFRVIENNYSAEYGRNAGGIVSVVTKSGTNKLHGTGYDYVRNNFFDANSFFNNQQGLSVPVLKRNQFGGTIGGPVLIPKIVNGKDKLFFFFSYEGQRQTALDASPGRVTTFTPAEANGDFSQSASASAVAAFLQSNPYYQANPNLAALGIIDPAKIDPVAKAYFANGLIPTSPTGYLFPQAATTNNYNEYLGKLDYILTQRDSLSATFTTRDNPQLFPFGPSNTSNVVGYPSTYANTSYFGSVTYTHTFTPALLNELRVTAQRLNVQQSIPASKLPTPAQLGTSIISDDPTGPPVLILGGSNLDIGNSPLGPTREIDNTYVFADSLSWIKGKHNLKLGFSFSPYQNNTTYDYYVNGSYFFYGPSTRTGSGLDLADFLMGNPDEYFQFGRAPSNIRSHQYAGFVQDSWKIGRRLTLNLGVRYEYAQPKYDTQGRTFSFVPGEQSTRFVNAPQGLLFPGDAGAPKGVNFPDKNDFAPRFGFAYDVFGNAKTSIRGGFGMFYDILKAEDNIQFNGQPPFASGADVYPTTYTGSGASGLQNPFASAGAVNPFPSRPPSPNINFNNAGFLPFGGGGVYFVDPHLRTPYVFQYNFSVQQQLPSNILLEVGYLGYSAHKLTGVVDTNPFVLGTDSRLYGDNFSFMNQFQNVGKANYNALEVNLRRDFSNMGAWGSSFFTVGYTWSHEIDNSSGFRRRSSNVPYYDQDLFRASGDTDLRNVFILSGGWNLPFEHLWQRGPKLLTSGWSLYPILTVRSGFPLDIFAGLTTSNGDPGPSGAGDAAIVRADLVGQNIGILNASQFQTLTNPNSGSANAGNYYFNPANFSVARATNLDINGTATSFYPYGTLPRNALRGPGQTNLDLSIAKHFKVREGMNLELRGDAFNVLNHTEFQNPNLVATTDSFGQISTTYAPRILQVALHLQF
jgi:outer membrane receptor protein involved in Fe transport